MGLVIASFAPGLFWLWFFLRHDKIRPEPRRLIALTFLLGCISTLPAGLGNYLFGANSLLEGSPNFISVVTAMTLVVGPVEELCKFGAVRLGPYRSLYFDEPVDGLVYASAASLGFASLENLFYVWQYGPAVMLLRAPLSTVGHLVFGSIWGYALGQYYISGGRKRSLLFGSLALAAGAHALFNVLVFSFPLGAVALVILGGIWSFRAIRKGDRHSPFRFRRNYPRIICDSCGAAMSTFNSFCTRCGAPRAEGKSTILCSNCGKPNRADAAFCTSCGDQFLMG
ncbi:MAG: PrsW family intramembrane metalloprotease [Caldilineaceae bacterium SB0664_bin_27]|uniref:PrsW family intramembrane metalloprotease n=1 Tax=Caldilineaceae bacterium SB0664_bin_27 TaxID=2605260 RepID=A0A6B0YU33_9CHLR|nr:PrsW family intramembrane metalloprotease [Caldilineaceae bacterium SB0664_bin_27]